MAALHPKPSDDGSANESSDLVDLFKLEATYTPEYTSQISRERDPSRGARKVKVEKKWYRGDSLGHGTCGAVWVERDSNVPNATTAIRAVKEVSKTHMKWMSLDYKRELIALARMSKDLDEFVEFYGWFEDKRTLYLTMEYFPHGDMSSFIEKGIPENEIKQITVQLLEGLVIMHENSFTHRDLKPANIFVKSPSPHWWVKIGDFGISKRVRENTALRTEVGTRGFLAPEVAIEGDEDYSSKVDLWSLGCVVFKSLAQVIPFPTYRSLESFCSKGAFPMEPLAAKKVTPEGVNFLQKLLVADPKDRWTAVDALDAEWLQSLDTIRPQEAEVSRQEVAGTKDTLVGRTALNFTNTSSSGHEHHKVIGVQSRYSPQNTEQSTPKDSGAMEPQNASIYPHRHGLEPAQSRQNKKTNTKLKRVPPMLQKNDDKTYRATEFGKDGIIGTPKGLLALISAVTGDTGDLNSGQYLNKSPIDRETSLRLQDKKQKSSQTALHPDIASKRAIQSAQATQLLLKNGFNIYAADFSANMALSWAAEKGHEAVVKLLLATDGTDPDSKDEWARTPLSRAAEMGHETVVKLLLTTDRIDPDSIDSMERTPLSWAAENGHGIIVKLLLATNEIDPNSKDAGLLTSLSYAAMNGHEAAVKLLLATDGIDPDSKDKWARTPLSLAAEKGHETVVKLLLTTDRIDPDFKDERAQTPLSLAAEKGHETVVKLLLATDRIDPNSEDEWAQTPLSRAAEKGHETVVKLLLATSGIDPDSKDERAQTPLSWAAEKGHETVVKLLLTTDGIDPDSKNERAQTPLSLAAENGHEAVVKLLLATDGTDPDSKDYIERTPLSLAARNGHEAVVKLLLAKNRVNPKSKDYMKRTPLSLAEENGHEAVVKLLQSRESLSL